MITIVLCGVVVSGASAAVTATKGATIEVETPQHQFTITGQTMNCKQGIFKGTAPAAEFTEISITPTFNECTGAGFEAKVTGFGQYGEEKTCHFVLHVNGTNDLVCETGADVTVDAATCIVHIPAQSGLGTTTYTSGTSGGVKDLTLDFNIKEIEATHTDNFLCPFNGGGTGKNGTFEGELTVHGTASGSRVAVDRDPAVGPFDLTADPASGPFDLSVDP